MTRKKKGDVGIYLRGVKFMFSYNFDGNELTGLSILGFVNG
jgi:hypothetical protein